MLDEGEKGGGGGEGKGGGGVEELFHVRETSPLVLMPLQLPE